MILTADRELMARIDGAVYPALVTNHHAARLPALARCLDFWRSAAGPRLAEAIVDNARRLGAALAARGLGVVAHGAHATDSHTVLLWGLRSGNAASRRLEECGVIAGECSLPEVWSREGLRFGVQELTRCGMGPGEMERVAAIIAAALDEASDPGSLQRDVAELTAAFPAPRPGEDA
jgi:glycine hydroxymethyltransferase